MCVEEVVEFKVCFSLKMGDKIMNVFLIVIM